MTLAQGDDAPLALVFSIFQVVERLANGVKGAEAGSV